MKLASDINAGLEALLHDLEAGNITPAEAKKSRKTSREDRSIRIEDKDLGATAETKIVRYAEFNWRRCSPGAVG